ncbi:MAG: hypothetical protein KDD60_06100 [Bdellovibrionales bacterium]|nr:hypothetical protein [Bdellovibrionales bacterium]
MIQQQNPSLEKKVDLTLSNTAREYTALLFECQRVSNREFDQALHSLRKVATKYWIGSLRFAADRLEYIRHHGIQAFNIGGTMGSGKSAVGKLLAQRIGFTFQDSDTFHSEENKAKMNQGTPLSDNDRVSFLNGIQKFLTTPRRVSSCSALTEIHRAILSGQNAELLRNPVATRVPLLFWNMPEPNYGLQHIILSKPYEIALEELEESIRSGKNREIDGKGHFIEVTRHTEYFTSISGNTPLLLNQYQLLLSKPIYPWDAITIDTTTMRTSTGYDCSATLERLETLPISTNDLDQASLFDRKE